MVFAGLRFFLAGILVILFGSIIKKKLLLPKASELPKILILSFFQTIGQYIFFYLGLSYNSGVDSAVINSLTTFFAILTASLVFRMEKLTFIKVLGCILGFIGVLIVNLDGFSLSFSLMGDTLLLLSAVCSGVSSSLIKKYSADHDVVLFSGYQFIFGGLIMSVVGMIGGIAADKTNMPPLNQENGLSIYSFLILIYLALVSSVAYTLWGLLLRKNDVSKIAIFGFMTPVLGVILSAVLLREQGQLDFKSLISLILISAGIIIVNLKTKTD